MMKNLKQYLNEKLVICHQQVDEKLIINKNYNIYKYHPTKWKELRQIIEDRYKELGPGTEQKPIDFNDVDVSGMTTFYIEKENTEIFQRMKFRYIDISDWDVSNIEDMRYMFAYCNSLKSVGDLSDWDVSRVENMGWMFNYCEKLESVGDLSKWDVSRVENMEGMFTECKKLKSVGNLSKWKVSRVNNMYGMFDYCYELESVGDLSKWDVSNVEFMWHMFHKTGITNKPKWYKE